MIRICIHGAYGGGNRGQDAILAQLLALLAAELPGARVTLLCDDRERLGQLLDREHSALPLVLRPEEASFRRNARGAGTALLGSDLFILGGGGLLHGGAPGNLSAWLRRPRLAGLLGRKVVFYSPGIFDLRGSRSRRLLLATARRAQFISVRDQGGYDALRDCGVPAERIHLGADPTFLLAPPEPDDVERLRDALELGEQRLIGLAARDWRHRLSAGIFANFVQKVLADASRTLLFFAMRAGGGPDEPEGGDLAVARSLLRTLSADQRRRFVVIDDSYLDDEVIALMGACDYLLGMRLHALIYASIAGTPFGAIACEDKLRQYMSMLGREEAMVELDALTAPGTLNGLIRHLEAERARVPVGPVPEILVAAAGMAARSRSAHRELAARLRAWFPGARLAAVKEGDGP